MTSYGGIIFVNIGSAKSFLPRATKSLPETILTGEQSEMKFQLKHNNIIENNTSVYVACKIVAFWFRDPFD